MISGDVHGPVSNMGNYNSGVIANNVHIFQSNRSELDAEWELIDGLTPITFRHARITFCMCLRDLK
jgi:hypothetical protein